MTLVAILLGLVALGGIGYAVIVPLLNGEAKSESRLKSISEGQTVAALKQEKDAVRRKQISTALDTSRTKNKDKETLEARIGQAGLTMSRSQYYLFCGLAGLGTGLLVLTMSGNFFMGLMAALVGSAGVPHLVFEIPAEEEAG